MGETEPTNLVVEHLREHGPASGAELPYSPDIQMRNIHRIHSTKGTYKHSAVYYLVDTHSKVEVVRKYIAENKQMLQQQDHASLTLMFKQIGPAFREAWKEIADEYNVRDRNNISHSHERSQQCPYCESTVKKLPAHLRNHCSEV